MNLPQTFNDLVAEAQNLALYKLLVRQLNKDFHRAQIDCQFDEAISPIDLKNKLQEAIFYLMQNKFSDYLNMLYIIDIPEHKMKVLDTSDPAQLAEEVTFLILQREWQKVWHRAKYSQ